MMAINAQDDNASTDCHSEHSEESRIVHLSQPMHYNLKSISAQYAYHQDDSRHR